MAIDKQKTRKCYDSTHATSRNTIWENPYLTRRPLNRFIGTVEDIRGVVAELLLNIDPSKIVLEYEPTMDGDRVAPQMNSCSVNLLAANCFGSLAPMQKSTEKMRMEYPLLLCALVFGRTKRRHRQAETCQSCLYTLRC